MIRHFRAEDGASLAGNLDECARFHGLQALYVSQIRSLWFTELVEGEVEALTSDHA